VTLMFGMYSLHPGTVRRVGWFAVTLFGAVMATMAVLKPEVYEPEVEVLHFFVLSACSRSVHARRPVEPAASTPAQPEDRTRRLLAAYPGPRTHDELTGLYNRRYMLDLLQLEHQRCMRSGHPFCVVMLDLDHFKLIQRHARPSGGRCVLRAFADEVRGVIRASDTIARWVAEEFSVADDRDARVARQTRRRSAARTHRGAAPAGVESSLPVTVSRGSPNIGRASP